MSWNVGKFHNGYTYHILYDICHNVSIPNDMENITTSNISKLYTDMQIGYLHTRGFMALKKGLR